MTLRLLITAVALLLAGCDIPGLGPDPRIAQRAAQAEADAKAIGAGCRHGLRSIESCYSLNDEASKAAIFIGWKEMDEYMRENKLEGVRVADPPASLDETVLQDSKSSAKGKDKKP